MAHLSRNKKVLVIVGSHGKTTTSEAYACLGTEKSWF